MFLMMDMMTCPTQFVHPSDPRSAEIFKQFVSGQMGESIISDYVLGLNNFPRLGCNELATEYFRLALQGMGEHWRRFSFKFHGFPYPIFKLVDIENDQDFLAEYKKLQNVMTTCPKCVDCEFSTGVLNFISPECCLSEEGVSGQIGVLKRFLYSLCCNAPLSTDVVECYHGFTQCQLYRWRGCKVTDPVAQERTLWMSICSGFEKFHSWMTNRFLDKGFWTRVSTFGLKTCNQYSQHAGHHSRMQKCTNKDTFSLEKLDRMVTFEQELPDLRKLSGLVFIACFYLS